MVTAEERGGSRRDRPGIASESEGQMYLNFDELEELEEKE